MLRAGAEEDSMVCTGTRKIRDLVRYCTLRPNRLFGGADNGSGGAGTRTLGCSKNRWAGFDGRGGTWGGWGEPTTRCGRWWLNCGSGRKYKRCCGETRSWASAFTLGSAARSILRYGSGGTSGSYQFGRSRSCPASPTDAGSRDGS
jgi:hypothetical protein